MGTLSSDRERLGETFDNYPNFYVDTASRQRILARVNPPAIRDFFVKYQDRILFGTDDLVLFLGRNPKTPGLVPRGRRTLPKLEQLHVNVSVLTDPMGRPINSGKNFTVTNAGPVISSSTIDAAAAEVLFEE